MFFFQFVCSVVCFSFRYVQFSISVETKSEENDENEKNENDEADEKKFCITMNISYKAHN